MVSQCLKKLLDSSFMDIVVRGSKDDSVVIGVSSFSGSGTGSTLKHDTVGIYPPRKRGLKIILHFIRFWIFSDFSISVSWVDDSIEVIVEDDGLVEDISEDLVYVTSNLGIDVGETVEVVMVVEESEVVMASIFLIRTQIFEW